MSRRFLSAAFAALLVAASGRAAGTVLGFDRPGDAFEPSPGFHFADEPPAAGNSPAPAARPPRRLFDAKTTAITAGVVLGSPVVGYFTWWRTSSRSEFTVANERGFQEDTYTGGGDKASHIYIGYLGSRILQRTYRSVGKTPGEARALALGVETLTGVLIELGDGYSQYGFAWEDLAANSIGALLAFGIDTWNLDDTVGLRMGLMESPIPPACCRYGGYGYDYSKLIHTLDLKLAGFLPRVGVTPGAARFLFLSGTYQSKGYRFSPSESRRREIGIEIGLNVREVLVAVGVREDKWWGKVLLGFAKYFRIPYTGWGWRYDLNSHAWTGPNAGNGYDPGYIIYD